MPSGRHDHRCGDHLPPYGIETKPYGKALVALAGQRPEIICLGADLTRQTVTDRTRQLKERKVRQFGELVIACSADALPIEQLAGALLAAVTMTDPVTKEGWRERGAAVFQRTAQRPAGGAGRVAGRESKGDGGGKSPSGGTGA